jgi:hypothetical protein
MTGKDKICRKCNKKYPDAIFVKNYSVVFSQYRVWREFHYDDMCFECYLKKEAVKA